MKHKSRLLVTQYSMKGLFVRKVVQIKAVRMVKGIITIQTVGHSRTKLWDEFDDLLDISQLDDIAHPCAIGSQMSVQQKHVDIWCWRKNIRAVNSLLV